MLKKEKYNKAGIFKFSVAKSLWLRSNVERYASYLFTESLKFIVSKTAVLNIAITINIYHVITNQTITFTFH